VDLAAAALDPTKDFVVEFELVTRPEFATPAWKGIEAKVPHPTVEESEVDRMVDELRRRRARLLTAEDAVVTEGDVLVVDWEARDGESVEAKDGGVYYPFGRGVIAGFVAEGLDDALRGAKAGAVATATVRVAVDDPREELRGRDLSLVVTLKEVKRYLLPALDADFLKALDYDDEKEMREDLRKRILRGKQRDTERLAEERLVEALLGQVEISLPEQFVERELQHWANRKRMEGEVEGIAEEVVTRGIDAARADARLHIERDMRRHFLLDRIAAEEGIEVTEAEIVEAIESIASAYGRPVEEVIDSFRDGGRLAELRSQVRHRKAREALRRHAKLVEEAPAAS
jgi:trigger factor